MGIPYCLRETVKSAVDIRDSLRANAQIDRITLDVSETIERKLCRRVFWPRLADRRWDWPDEDRPTPWRLWLGGETEVAEIISFDSGGTPIDLADILPYPDTGPPYTRLELNRSTAGGFSAGATPQKSIGGRFLFAGAPVIETVRTTLAEALDATETDVDVASVEQLGVGALLRVDDERLLVTGSRALATGATLAADLGNQVTNTALALSTAVGAPQPGEVIAVGGERMLVLDLIGATAYVRRAYDGTAIVAHTTGAAVYAYRTLIVERGYGGTTAAAHSISAPVRRWMPPALIEGLAVAETLNQIAQEGSAYARVIGTGENQREARGHTLRDKRADVRAAWGRRVRMGAI